MSPARARLLLLGQALAASLVAVAPALGAVPASPGHNVFRGHVAPSGVTILVAIAAALGASAVWREMAGFTGAVMAVWVAIIHREYRELIMNGTIRAATVLLLGLPLLLQALVSLVLFFRTRSLAVEQPA